MKQLASQRMLSHLIGTQTSILVKYRNGIITNQCMKCFCLFSGKYCHCDPRYKSVFDK